MKTETVKLKECVNTGRKTKKGDPIIEIELEDGRQGAGYDNGFIGLPLNQDITLQISTGKVWNDVQQYNFALPTTLTPSQSPLPLDNKDKTSNKKDDYVGRYDSLDLAIMALGKVEGKSTLNEIYTLADDFYKYLNN